MLYWEPINMPQGARCDVFASMTRVEQFFRLSHSAYSESCLCRPWLPKRVFGGTPVSTEWFSDLPTNFGLSPVRCSQWHKKNGYPDRLKRSRWYILSSTFVAGACIFHRVSRVWLWRRKQFVDITSDSCLGSTLRILSAWLRRCRIRTSLGLGTYSLWTSYPMEKSPPHRQWVRYEITSGIDSRF